jgi:hypothetical protein
MFADNFLQEADELKSLSHTSMQNTHVKYNWIYGASFMSGY